MLFLLGWGLTRYQGTTFECIAGRLLAVKLDWRCANLNRELFCRYEPIMTYMLYTLYMCLGCNIIAIISFVSHFQKCLNIAMHCTTAALWWVFLFPFLYLHLILQLGNPSPTIHQDGDNRQLAAWATTTTSTYNRWVFLLYSWSMTMTSCRDKDSWQPVPPQLGWQWLVASMTSHQ